MKINLAYGQGHLPVNLPDDRTTVIEPAHLPGLPDEKAALRTALDSPARGPCANGSSRATAFASLSRI
jgi:hypothetical protein